MCIRDRAVAALYRPQEETGRGQRRDRPRARRLVLVPGSHERLSRAPQAAEPGRGGGGRARSDLRPGYEQQRDSPLEATLDIVRPAEALQPNSPSCGNQPANISLTAPSRTDTHANSSTLVRPQERRPRSHPGAASVAEPGRGGGGRAWSDLRA